MEPITRFEIDIHKGATLQTGFEYTWLTSLAGATASMGIRDRDSGALLATLTTATGDGLTITDLWVNVTVSAARTSTMVPGRVYYADIKITLADGTVIVAPDIQINARARQTP